MSLNVGTKQAELPDYTSGSSFINTVYAEKQGIWKMYTPLHKQKLGFKQIWQEHECSYELDNTSEEVKLSQMF